ncbi:hypothetical protein QFZ35_002826 [Arthrobacter ulcerisalmonis]|uniref:hypothetical protein n=1 Tax=Arthrobacter sp. B1I2 TaxID=3042263 RepID=UPI002783EBDE|nr:MULTISPECIES: hypothetical protein [Arthrobacter]MDQ0664328.1 hypothetical protein [Arthrobacter ulcerisalmonis]MDQ0732238.1 hypothetical protein [Arthrobacter sp. B1I2]
MAHSQFDQFLSDATYHDLESDSTLDGDSLYGLYTSWCYLSGKTPRAEHVFWAAMRQRVGPGQCLKMKGPAAADYILSSYQAVV